MKLSLIIIALSTLSLFGCTSIKQPMATIDLVDEQTHSVKSALDESLSNMLSRTDDEFILAIKGVDFTVNPIFFSAAGKMCRHVTNSQEARLYCQNDSQQWEQIASVLSVSGLNQQESTQ